MSNYEEDEEFDKFGRTFTPGRKGASRRQAQLHRLTRTTDPWHGHNIDDDDDYDDDVTVIIPGYGEGKPYDSEEDDENEPKDENQYRGPGSYDLAERRFGRVGRGRVGRRRRRGKMGRSGARKLHKEKAETKDLERQKRQLRKEAKTAERSDRKAAHTSRREDRRADRLRAGLLKENKRQEQLRKEIAKLQAEAGREEGTPPRDRPEEDLETQFSGNAFECDVHNLRFAGDVLEAMPGSVVLSVNGSLTSGKSVYDTNKGRPFFHKIMEHDDEDFFNSREEAMDFVSEQFGLDFAGADEHKFTGALTLCAESAGKKVPVATLEPFTINTDLDTAVDSIKGFDDDADNTAAAFEGGWKATLMAGATLHGRYGGEEGKLAAVGDSMFYFEDHIQNGDSEVPVIVHLESMKPVSMKPKDGKITTEFAAQYLDLLHPDAEPVDGIADRIIRLTQTGSSCKVNISTAVNFS